MKRERTEKYMRQEQSQWRRAQGEKNPDKTTGGLVYRLGKKKIKAQMTNLRARGDAETKEMLSKRTAQETSEGEIHQCGR